MREYVHARLILCVLLAGGACSASHDHRKEAPMGIVVTSPAFKEGTPIPTRHTCDGEDVSPALAWTGIPEGAKSIVVICDDPDAPVGTWVHWVLYNVPATAQGLPEGVAKAETLPDGSRQGLNDFGRVGYGGPCPPRGKPHRYYWRVYALDTMLSLPSRATRKAVDNAMRGHVLASGVLMGTYARR